MDQLRPETIEYLKGRRVGLSTRMSDRSLARNGGQRRQRFMGRARLFLGKALVSPYASNRVSQFFSKDDGGLSVGDVHIPSALGNSPPPRRRRPIRKDWAEFDRQRGAGESTGRAGGLAFGIFHAPRVGRAVGHALIRRGFRAAPAVGAGIVAGYGAVRGAQAAGGYVGRKVDDAVSGLFR